MKGEMVWFTYALLTPCSASQREICAAASLRLRLCASRLSRALSPKREAARERASHENPKRRGPSACHNGHLTAPYGYAAHHAAPPTPGRRLVPATLQMNE